MCWGSCCPLVNLTLKSLVEIGELGMNTEVSFYIYKGVWYLISFPRIFALP